MGEAAFGPRGPMTDGGEGALDRVAGADVLSTLGADVVEGEAFGGLGAFRVVLCKETIKGLVSLITALGHPDFLEIRLGSWLDGFREFFEDVHHLIDPTPLVAGDREFLFQRFSEAERAITDGQSRCSRQTAAFQINKQFGP